MFLARFTAVVRAFVPLVAGILKMSPLQFYAANILSALAWAPAHVFPGVLLAMAISLAGASAEQLTLLIIAGLIVVSAACWFLPRRRLIVSAVLRNSAASSVNAGATGNEMITSNAYRNTPAS